MHVLIEEILLNDKQRGIKIILDNQVIYSMDYYEQIDFVPECKNKVFINDIELCYFDISEKCKGLIVKTEKSIEMITLRYFVNKNEYENKLDDNTIYNNCINLFNNFKLSYKKQQNPLNP